jgi:hypothetical protein
MPAPRARSVSHVLPTQLPCRSAGSIRSLSVRVVNDACILRAQADVAQIDLVTKRSTTSKTCFFECVRLVNREKFPLCASGCGTKKPARSKSTQSQSRWICVACRNRSMFPLCAGGCGTKRPGSEKNKRTAYRTSLSGPVQPAA